MALIKSCKVGGTDVFAKYGSIGMPGKSALQNAPISNTANTMNAIVDARNISSITITITSGQSLYYQHDAIKSDGTQVSIGNGATSISIGNPETIDATDYDFILLSASTGSQSTSSYTITTS